MTHFLSLLMSNFLYLFLKVSYSQSFPPPLSAAEEAECFKKMRQGDRLAREKLIKHNLRLVAHIVKKYYASGVDQDDLISIGTIGLIKAIDSFDSTNGARFATYAAKCLQNAILSKRLILEYTIKIKLPLMKNGVYFAAWIDGSV